MGKVLKYVLSILGITILVAIIVIYLVRQQESTKLSSKSEVAELQVKEINGVRILGFYANDTSRGFSFLARYRSEFLPSTGKRLPFGVVKKCIETTPEIKGNIVWRDYNRMIFEPNKDELLPDELSFKFSCIPLDSGRSVRVNDQKVIWKFLPIVNVKVEYPTYRKAKVLLYFGLPVKDTMEAMKYIQIGISRESRVKTEWAGNAKLIFLVNIPDTGVLPVKVQLREGLEFKGNVKIQRAYTKIVNIGKIMGGLLVDYIKFHKTTGGGYLECSFHPVGTGKVSFSSDVKDFISLTPSLKFTAGVSKNKIYIYGNFEGGKRYTILFKSGLRSKEGYALKNDFKRTFDVPIPDARLTFLSRGLYIGKGSAAKVPFSLRRIKEVYLSVEWMPPEHIPFYYFAGNGESSQFYKFGKNVVDDVRLPFVNKGYKEKVEFLDLGKYIDLKNKGLYRLHLDGLVSGSKEHRHVSTKMVVAITDLAIVAKYSDSILYAWIFDVNSLTPANGVKVTVYSSSGFVIGEAVTNNDGVGVVKTDGELAPYVVTAEKGNDWSFINLNETGLDLSHFRIEGKDEINPYSAMLYFQRDLYRPGDTIFYNVLVRKSGTYDGASLPIRVKIRDPKGKTLSDLHGTTDNAGYFGGYYLTQPISPTGRYSFDVYIGGRLYTSQSVNVETFVPERIALDIDAPPSVFDRQFKAEISAMYLFGTPCSNSPYTVRIFTTPLRYVSHNYPQYEFGMPDRTQYRKLFKSYEGDLDNMGKTDILVDLQDAIRDKSNAMKVDLVASIREEQSGRSTEKTRSLRVYASPYYIGLRSNKKSYKNGEKVMLDGIVLSPQDTIFKAVKYVKVTLYRLEYYYSYWYEDEYYEPTSLRWDRWRVMLPVREVDSVPVNNGKFAYSFTYPSDWEDYVVEAETPSGIKARELLQSDWWWWGESTGGNAPPPEILNLALSKDTADEGESVTARVKLPFAGWVLWSLELDTVYESHWQRVEGKTAEWTFKAPKGIPNAYVSCLLVRNSGNYMLKRGIGIKRLKIIPKRLILNVNVDAPVEVKPGSKIKIVLSSKEDFEATVSVVDEGILNITEFKTPDPVAGILSNIGLLFKTSETFGWFRPSYLKTGGGFLGKEEPAQPKFFTTVTYFSGLRKSKNGRLKLEVPVGNYQGKVRVMVSAFNKDKMAKVEKEVKVKSDVVVFVTMPRFLYVNDTFYLPVTFMNTTDKSMDVSLKLKPSNIVIENYPGKVSLKKKEKKSVSLKCYVKRFSKNARLDIYADFEKGAYRDSFIIPIYPDKPYVTETKSYKVTPHNGIVHLDSMLSGYLPPRYHVDIYVTPNIYLRGIYSAREVIGYPYGCVEQTSSKLYMLCALAPYIELFKDIVSTDDINYYINGGISRLISMQTWEGGFSFWPGGPTDKGYSGYATLVLEIAKQKGYYVPDGVLDAAFNYLESNGKDVGLSLYALALGGRLNTIPGGVESAVKVYKNSKYVPERLWAILALYESGRVKLARRFFGEIIRTDTVIKKYWLPLYYIYRETLFDNGLKLYVAEHIGFDEKVVDSLAQEVNMSLIKKDYRYCSTQSLVWSLLGLSEYSKRFNTKLPDIKLYVSGKPHKGKRFQQMLHYHLDRLPSGDVYLQGGDSSYYVMVQNTGFKINAKFEEEFDGLTVSRDLYTYEGKPIANEVLKPGDLVIMKVSWKSDDWMKNVAIEVPVPAGMDIENPRLTKESLPAWTSRFENIRRPDYVDIKDDRIVIFTESSDWPANYFILLRANLRGNFFLSPARGVVMYRPELFYHGQANRIRIR